MRTMIFCLAIFLLPTFCLATTWYVPDDYTTIQGAISNAAVVNGDTIIVRSGTYSENIDFLGKGITVQSESGPAVTTIDGSQSGSVVTFDSFEGLDSVLDGFTLTNGSGNSGWYGGGVYIDDSSPMVINNVIEGNDVALYGGGIFIDSSASPKIATNVIENNVAGDQGGGIYAGSFTSPTITDNEINENTADYWGGGIFFGGSDPVVTGNTFYLNYAYEYGGGIYSEYNTDTVIQGNLFDSNLCDYYGGGVYFSDSPGSLNNNIFLDNTAWEGAAVFNDYFSIITLDNNTFQGNVADNLGDGLYCYYDSEATVTNCIFWDDTAGSGPEIVLEDGGIVTISYCDVEGGLAACDVDGTSTLNWGDCMIEDNPLFVDLGADDLHLAKASPCVNRGVEVAGLTDDYDGNLRPTMGSYDMGAYEYVGTHFLAADGFTMSQSLGGTINMTLDAGAAAANRWYLMLGTRTGTAPGIPLPGGLSTLPLNWDTVTDYILGRLNTFWFPNFMGPLNGAGTSAAAFLITPNQMNTNWIGRRLHFAFLLDDPFEIVSNPVEALIVP